MNQYAKNLRYAGMLTSTIILAGCMTPTSIIRTVSGIEYVEHRGAESPCGPSSGCYSNTNGRHEVWIASSMATEHEEAHVLGMRHGEWEREWGNRSCTKVTVSGGKYKAGQTICITQRGEEVI